MAKKTIENGTLLTSVDDVPEPHNLYIVAHLDDDLLFMNPEISTSIRSGYATRTIFLVTWVMEDIPEYWQTRETGTKEAYAHMAGVINHWRLQVFTVAGHELELYTLVESPHVSLIFLRLPDNADTRPGVVTLRELYDGPPNQRITSIDGLRSYNKGQLISLLTALMESFQATSISMQNSYVVLDNDRTMVDGATTDKPPYRDHPDHIRAAKLVEEAQQAYTANHAIVRYRDYDIQNEPANLSADEQKDKLHIFEIYAKHDLLIGDECSGHPHCARMETFTPWTARRYFALAETAEQLYEARGQWITDLENTIQSLLKERARAETAEQLYEARGQWITDLENTIQSLLKDYEAERARAETAEQLYEARGQWITDLDAARIWNDEQRQFWEQRAHDLEGAIQFWEQKARDLEGVIQSIESRRMVRLYRWMHRAIRAVLDRMQIRRGR